MFAILIWMIKKSSKMLILYKHMERLFIFITIILNWCDTLQSKATDTSKTYIVPKVFILRNMNWFCLKAHYLPFVHAKFQSTGFNGLASTQFRNLIKLWEFLTKKCVFKPVYMNISLKSSLWIVKTIWLLIIERLLTLLLLNFWLFAVSMEI